MSGGKACCKPAAQYTGKQPDEGSVVISRDTAAAEKEVHSSGHTLRRSKRTRTTKQVTQPLLLAADAPFAAALEAVPAEDWCRTWATGRTIMLRRTSKRVKEVVDKIRLPAVVRLSRSFWDDVAKKVGPAGQACPVAKAISLCWADETPETHYDSLTVATLKTILRNRNLLVTGNKDDLVARLYIYDAGSKGPGARKASEKTHFVMKQLTLMTAWCRISTLELPRCDMKGQDADSLAGVLAQCPALAHLDLSENYNFGAAGAERLAGVLAQCRELVRLNLSRNKIGAGGAERLAGVLGHCPALAHLNLRSNSIGPDGAESLAGVLAQCAALAHLNLSCNAIGAAGAESLAGVLPQCTALAHLNLWYNEIEAAGAVSGGTVMRPGHIILRALEKY